MNDVNPLDWHLYIKDDPSFNAKRNQAVLDEVLRKADILHYAFSAKAHKDAGNRADMLSSYGVYRLSSGGTKKFDDYMGKGRMKQIYGEKILEKIRVMESIEKLNQKKGNTKFTDFYLS